MNSNENIIDQTLLIGGDIILCYGGGKKDIIAKGIEKITGSKYKHAAICLDTKNAAESGMSGVKKESIKNIIQRYGHVAIFRQPDAWGQDRINALNLFIDKAIETGARYNLKGIRLFSKNKNEHNGTMSQKLDSYFKGELEPGAIEKGNYFCSELVVNCLTATGFITPSAAVLYKGDTFSPVDLGKDPTFGTFLGFIISENDYQILETDDFYYNTTFGEIFERYNK
ncbi:MAG: hypothetical protein KAT25_03695 [Sulfuriflexus sp.]|nr:hypothetical protein [Sulfuriflexus sp.]